MVQNVQKNTQSGVYDYYITPEEERGADWYLTHWLLHRQETGMPAPLLVGYTGTGKTARAYELAALMGVEVVELNVCGLLPEDVTGIPDAQSKEAFIERKLLASLYPATQKKVVLFIDEMDKADEAMMNVLLKIVHQKMIGDHKIHPDTAIVCAMQPIDEKVILRSNTLVALLNRVVPIPMRHATVEQLAQKIDNFLLDSEKSIKLFSMMMGEAKMGKDYDDVPIPRIPYNSRRMRAIMGACNQMFLDKATFFKGDRELTTEVMALAIHGFAGIPMAASREFADTLYEEGLARESRIEITQENIADLLNRKELSVWDLTANDIGFALPPLYFNIEAPDGHKAFNDFCCALKRAYTELPSDARYSMMRDIISYGMANKDELNGKEVFPGVSADEAYQGLHRVMMATMVTQQAKIANIPLKQITKEFPALVIDEQHEDVFAYPIETMREQFVEFTKRYGLDAKVEGEPVGILKDLMDEAKSRSFA